MYATVCLSFWPRAYVCLKVCLQISMTSQLVQAWFKEIAQGFTEVAHFGGIIFARPRAHGGMLRATFLASNLLVGFHPVLAFISQLKMHFEV